MTQYEFIQELERALQGQVSLQTAEYNVNYYKEYIREQIASGKTEEEVIDTLGSPRVIAKTIIIAEEAKKEESQKNDSGVHSAGEKENKKPFDFDFNWNNILYGKWYYKVLAIVIAILVLYLVCKLIFSAIRILFWPAVIAVICYSIWNIYKSSNQ